ncbi:unnamed protein product [Diatraea saccharalis]|uniref:Ras-GEF domain-containing protein n=1 Tax=Diatraea saccharalis TaxID=40085 RepID=A0A9N9R590_9NEOP|nr:unnamed protein product [Diatraea saccharalis]
MVIGVGTSPSRKPKSRIYTVQKPRLRRAVTWSPRGPRRGLVPPIDYLRQVTLDLGGEGVLGAVTERHMIRRAPPTHTQQARSTVRALIRRFNEVSAWVTELVLTQTSSEERKAALACVLRVALTCWNIGNFNGAMEIVAGLKSNKLKAFWFSISDEPLPALDFLSAALLSAEYERALGRALAMPECRLIPFFGAFLRELREILAATPALTSHSVAATPTHRREFKRESVKEDRGSQKKDPRRESGKRVDQSTTTSPLRDSCKRDVRVSEPSRQVYIASFDEDGEQAPGWRRVGPEGLVNLEKVYRTQAVMDHIASFHQHHYALARNNAPIFGEYLRAAISSCEEPVFSQSSQKTSGCDFENEALYELEGGGYCPVQPLPHDHGVTMFPLAPQNGERIDRHVLQIMQHGTACVVGEAEWGGALAQLRLERACALLTWCRTAHTPHHHHGDMPSENIQQPEVSLSYNPEEVIPLKYSTNLTHENEAGVVAEEGFIDLQCVKDMRLGGKLLEPRDITELTASARRHGLESHTPHIISLVYGKTLSDNRTVHFVLPSYSYKVWAVGLHSVIKALMSQAKLADRSLAWLKNKYTALYYEDGCCCEPLVSDAIRVFGGRESVCGSSSHSTPVKGVFSESHSDSIKSAGIKFKKNKSTSELKTCSPKSYGSTHTSGTRSEDEVVQGSPRHSSYSATTSHHHPCAPRHSSLTAAATSIIAGSPNRSSLRRLETSERFWENLKHLRTGSVGYDTQLDFMDFVALFRSFSLVMRSELRDVFEQLAVPRNRTPLLAAERSLLTRNGSLDLEPPSDKAGRKKAFDLLAAAALPGACPEVSGRVLSLPTLGKFCETRQNEPKTEAQLKDIIQVLKTFTLQLWVYR